MGVDLEVCATTGLENGATVYGAARPRELSHSAVVIATLEFAAFCFGVSRLQLCCIQADLKLKRGNH